MPKGDGKIIHHKCKDGEIRRIVPVYFREVDPQTDRRRFVREAWFCGHCGYGDWKPLFTGVNLPTA